MTINGTLIVQMFNFLITYAMLRMLLFKPVINIIEHEKAQENAMLDIIDQQMKSLEIQEKERQRHWYICQEYFKTDQPPVHKELLLLDDTAELIDIAPDVSPNIDHIIAETNSIIEEKLKHVQ